MWPLRAPSKPSAKNTRTLITGLLSRSQVEFEERGEVRAGITSNDRDAITRMAFTGRMPLFFRSGQLFL